MLSTRRSSSLPIILAVLGAMLFAYGATNNAKSTDEQYELEVKKLLAHKHKEWRELSAEFGGNLSTMLDYCPPLEDRNDYTAYYCPKEWEKRVRVEVSAQRTKYENRAQGLMLGGGICFLANIIILIVIRRKMMKA